MKLNGGILSIKYQGAGKFLFLLFVCSIQYINSQKIRIITDNKIDSVFCAENYPFYDFENNQYLYGITFPEKSIEGKDINIEEINKAVRDSILDNFVIKDIGIIISMYIMVDEFGKVRGAVLLNYNENNDLIAKYAYELLKRYEYIPAYLRGNPKTFIFPFGMVKKE